jgi:hypothetical protein
MSPRPSTAAGSPFSWRSPPHRITEPSVGELKRILADHPGDSPLHLTVRDTRKTVVYALGATVNAATLASDIKGTFRRRRADGYR